MGGVSVWHWIVVILAIALPVMYILSFRKTSRVVNSLGGDGPVELAWLLLFPIVMSFVYFILLVKLKAGSFHI